MNSENQTFNKYHLTYEKLMANSIRGHIQELNYEASNNLVKQQGWETLAEKDHPSVLLCGTGSSETSSRFVHFVRGKNPSAKITILDLQEYPLLASREQLRKELDGNLDGIAFVQTNALTMPFEDSSFDMIETDFFLQFFSSEQKANLLKEWQRVLKPSGIVTTRDYVQRKGNAIERIIDGSHIALVRRGLGVQAYSTLLTDLVHLFKDANFDIVTDPIRIAKQHITLPLITTIVALKRE